MTQQMTTTVPVFNRLDRMGKALDHAGLTTQEMAEYLGVQRETISRWLNGRSTPSTGMLRAWALRTQVPYEWIESGERACRDSNPKPSGWSYGTLQAAAA
jgi:excisionase family DNA binding protein